MATNPSHASPRPRRDDALPRPIIYAALLLVCLAFVPPAIVARVRAAPSPHRRIQIFQDMGIQPRFNAQQGNPVFADDRAMRQPVAGTVARQDPEEIGVRIEGAEGGAWSATLPEGMSATVEFLRRGQERFNIYCALCHGYAGFGDGIIDARAEALMNNAEGPVNGTTWVKPRSLHEPEVVAQPIGQIQHTIANGIRNMAGYAAQIPVEDRWAIAAYVKALQKSQDASPAAGGGRAASSEGPVEDGGRS